MTMTILNISAYKFVGLDDLHALRARIVERCEALALKGTILLAPEGINLFLAASPDAVAAFIDWLREDPRFADLVPKESLSDAPPFRRMRVRLKKEIITMHAPAIRPAEGRAPHVLPADLRRWLDRSHDDAGREVVTRVRVHDEVAPVLPDSLGDRVAGLRLVGDRLQPEEDERHRHAEHGERERIRTQLACEQEPSDREAAEDDREEESVRRVDEGKGGRRDRERRPERG